VRAALVPPPEELGRLGPRQRRLLAALAELGELTVADVDWYFRHFSRPEIVLGQGYPPPADRAAAEAELRTFVLDLFGVNCKVVFVDLGYLDRGSFRVLKIEKDLNRFLSISDMYGLTAQDCGKGRNALLAVQEEQLP